MTQPVFPSLMPQGPRVPMVNVTQAPVTGPAGVGPTGVSPVDAELRRIAEREAEEERAQRAQAALEARHGVAGTIGRSFARGVLHGILSPGALFGAAVEGTGELTGADWLRDFGRDLGEAAQGSEAMAVLAAAAPTDSAKGEKALDQYLASMRETREEKEAWPMLSATSELAGQVGVGLATGGVAGLAKGGVGLAGQAGLATLEGAGLGAQDAYAKNAPLRDVVTSTLVGAVLGGGLTYGVGKGVPYLQQKAAGGLRDFAEKRTVKAGVGNYKQAWKRITRGGKEPQRINRIGRKLLDRGVDIGDVDDMVRGIAGEVDDATTRLDTISTTLTSNGVKVPKNEPLGAIDGLIAEYRKEPFGSLRAVADRIENEIAPLRQFADEIPFDEYWRVRQKFDKILYNEQGARIRGPVGEGLERARGVLDDALNKAVDGVGDDIGRAWRAGKEDYGDMITMKELGDELIQARMVNRALSPSDHGLGIGAFVGAMAGDFSGLSSAAIGAGVAAANKLARERGPGMLAKWANALAGHADDAGHVVSVAAAGGREAQDAITKIEKGRRAIREAAESVGPNPAQQQAVRREATEMVMERLAKEAGELDPNWVKKPPSTLQKVIHRSQILDQVSSDTAAAVQKVTALRPALSTPLAQRRLGKLLKDADGPAAIGGVQQRLATLMEQLPRSAEGNTLRGALKAYTQQLNTAGTAETMRVAHDLVLRFSQAAQVAADPAVKSFSARAAADLAKDLSGPAWGAAGKHYATLSRAPQDALSALSDPAVLRDALRTVDLRGKLSGAARDGTEKLRQAQTAAAELTGAKATVSEADLKALERLFEQAEEAVTLDGGPVGRVLEYFAQQQGDKVAGGLGVGVQRALGDQPGSAAGNVVAHAVRSRLGKLARVLHTTGHATEETGIHLTQSSAFGSLGEGKAAKKAARPLRMAAGLGAAAVGTRALLTPQEKQQQFRNRSELLTEIVRDQDLDLTDGLAAVGSVLPGVESMAMMDFREKVEAFERNAPKVKQGFRGPELPSSQEVRLFNAQFEALTDPLSVFDDLAAGTLDHDKVQAAWSFYPGLQTAAQFGLQDILFHQMSDEQRAAMPEHVLSQLDNLLGLGGSLQPTLAREFVQTVDMVAQQAASRQKPTAKKPLELPTAAPTPITRLQQARR